MKKLMKIKREIRCENVKGMYYYHEEMYTNGIKISSRIIDVEPDKDSESVLLSKLRHAHIEKMNGKMSYDTMLDCAYDYIHMYCTYPEKGTKLTRHANLHKEKINRMAKEIFGKNSWECVLSLII